MKKLFMMLLTLFILYLGVQLLFNLFSKGDSNSYTIEDGNTSFEVYEQSYFLNKRNNYSYSIKGERTTFNFQIDENFNKENEILKDIKYYKDKNYECILPIFKGNKIVIDMMCYNGKRTTYYHNLKGVNSDLDKYIIKIDNYNIANFVDNENPQTIERLSVYKNNLVEDHYLAFTNYKGVYDVSDNFNSIVYDISLFSRDVYNPKISAFVNNYYVTADYDQEYNFRKFNIVDLVRLNTKKITTDYKISFDCYVQGVVDDKLYIYDYENKTQYEINIEKETITSYTGNNLKYYDNGTWTTMSTLQANQGLTFKYPEVDLVDNNYSRIDKVGNEVGYYYLYKKNGNSYEVYSMDIQNKDSLKYIFNTKTIDNIFYIDEYIYFVDKDEIKLFSHEFGVKKLIQYKELQFNKNQKLHVYSK